MFDIYNYMNVGIYKWTSPTNKVYVGQSKNLIKRKEWYLSKGIEAACMPKLKRSFKKYGIDNHIFEIIEYCSEDQLNNREIHWGLFYDTLENGLNCKLGEQNCIFSNETKNKMSKVKKGIPLSKDHQENRMKSLKKYWDELKIKNLNKPKLLKQKYTQTEDHKRKISESKKGKSIHTEESKQKLSEYGKNRDLTNAWKAVSEKRSKPVLQYSQDGEFLKEWQSADKAEVYYNNKKGDNIGSTIRYFNKTGIQRKSYGFIWKFK